MRSRTWVVLSALLSIAISSGTVHIATAEVLPAGTVVHVRTTQPIAAESTAVGMRFGAIVDDPVVEAGGRIIIPRGAPATLEAVSVEQSSNLKGRDRITLKVRAIRIGGSTYPVTTSRVELKGPSEGKRAARKIGGGAGLGAAVGGIFGGGSGAAIGAVAGGATGAAVAGSGKTRLNIPAETRLQFRLDAPLRIQ